MTEGLAARRVTRRFRGGAGVTAVDLDVRPGEVHALVGLNGAGKTTLMKLLLGMLRPDDGDIRLDGIPLTKLPPAAWAGFGHVVEAPLAYGDLTARENMLISARLHGLTRAETPVAVDAAIDELGLEAYASVRARRLSAGNRQRIGLASALQHHPRILVLDEPTSTLDPAGVLLLRDALRQRAAAGAAILVSSHHLDEVSRVADRITVLNSGRVIGSLDPGLTDLEQRFFHCVLIDDEAQRRS